jgi:tRNA threonylcarbamoyladenosine biosynthesis protein TsaB
LKVLAVHSTSPSLGIALTDGETSIGRKVLAPGKNHLENLAPLIRDLMKEADTELRDVDGFGVAIGPGSFSGIRVGMAAVKGMALVLGKPVVGISSLEILAWEGLLDGDSGVAVIKAGRGDLYAALYGKTQTPLSLLRGPMLIPGTDIGEFLVEVGAKIIVCADASAAGEDQWDSFSATVRVVDHSPVGCGLLANKRLERQDHDSVHSIKPLYIRRSDAEVKRSPGAPET